MKLAVQKNHFGGQILYRSPDLFKIFNKSNFELSHSEATHTAINASVNVLTPSAGPAFKPKPKPKRNAANNPLVSNLQHQARSQIPQKQKKPQKAQNVPVRSFLPNMNPYTHRERDNKEKHTENMPTRDFQEIPSTLPPLPVERKREKKMEKEIANIPEKKKKISEPAAAVTDEWADLPDVRLCTDFVFHFIEISKKKFFQKFSKTFPSHFV